MTTRILGITADADLMSALRLMAERGVQHLPVFDGPRCCGLLFEIDIVEHLAVGEPAQRSTGPIAHLVRPAAAVTTAARRSDVARAMQETRLDAVLVTEHGRLAGIVTTTDVIASLASPAAQHPSGGDTS
ncbi:hypothetical protein GCM10009559_05690 [Pseudonocardia zijingensis]|jgi:CBS domain-containing protein|uniref:CBS domain-containing protein n=2 Tax=Pseudonocardia zijingensis TaxID=153376 RepID=A0ABN1P3Y7_9PSEU